MLQQIEFTEHNNLLSISLLDLLRKVRKLCDNGCKWQSHNKHEVWFMCPNKCLIWWRNQQSSYQSRSTAFNSTQTYNIRMPVDYQSSLLTTFNTPLGRCRFLTLPFGFKNASEIFQKSMGSAFEGFWNMLIRQLMTFSSQLAPQLSMMFAWDKCSRGPERRVWSWIR